MTTARRQLTVLCLAAAALSLAWSTAAAGAEPLDPGLCPVEPAGLACGQPAPGANRRPDAVDDQLTTRPGNEVMANLLGNDVDPDGDTLYVRPETGRTLNKGTFAVAVDGSFTYTPPPGFVGADFVGYSVTDGRGESDIATVTVQVVNGAPVAANHRLRTRRDEPTGGNLLAGARDPDGDPFRLHPFDVVADGGTAQEGGKVTIGREGDFSYRPPPPASSAATASATP